MEIIKNTEVLLITEGTYPFNTGGVSTWAHDICQNLPNIDFTLYSINAGVEHKAKYALTENIKNIIQVPMWAPEEPFDCVDYGLVYSDILNARAKTTEAEITSEFIPYFSQFITLVYQQEQEINALNECVFKMWQFFQTRDYKTAMTSEAVWNSFCKTIENCLTAEEMSTIKLIDVTAALRWLYRFLIPIAIDVPKVDVSHVTISGIAILPALNLKYKYNTPILVTEHGVFIRERMIAIGASDFSFFLKKLLINFSESITRLVYHHADKITTVSKFNMSWEALYGAATHKIELIYNGVNPNIFVPLAKPDHLKNIPTVVAAARIFDLKDILTMIRVSKEVSKIIPNVQFLVYGNKDAVPEYTDACEALIVELNVSENFMLKGFHNEPAKIFSEGDISILTSISEGFPFTVIESMSCGVPVVSTDVGGVSEALTKDCGYICKPKDYKEIADKVIILLQDDALRKQMGKNSRQRVIEHFSLEVFVTAFDRTYQNLAQQHMPTVIH